MVIEQLETGKGGLGNSTIKRITVIQPRCNEGLDYCLKIFLWFHLHQLPQVGAAGFNYRAHWKIGIRKPGFDSTVWLESGPAAGFLLIVYIEAVFLS